MNKIYKVIFNKRKGIFVVTSELGKNINKKSETRKNKKRNFLSLLTILTLPTIALAEIQNADNSYLTEQGIKKIIFETIQEEQLPANETITENGVEGTISTTAIQNERIDDTESIALKRKITKEKQLGNSTTTLYSGVYGLLDLNNGLTFGKLVGVENNNVVTYSQRPLVSLNQNGIQFFNRNASNTVLGGLLSTNDGGDVLTWSGTGGISLNGKIISYNQQWDNASGGNTGLVFNGKPITPYFGVNSGVNGGNYYGQGATGSNAIAIGYGASSTNLGAIAIGYGAYSANSGNIAIGQNANAANRHSIAIGWNAKVAGVNGAHGIAIGGAENAGEAAIAARSSIAMGYNVRLDKAAHSFGFGINLHMGGYRNIAISAAGSFSSPTSILGYGNTVIGSDNKLEGQSYTKINDYEYNYKDIASNVVLGELNKIVGTADTDATPSDYSGATGAYRNAIVGMNNNLNGNNYFNMLLASNATLATGSHHNTLLGGGITVETNVNNSLVLGNNTILRDGSHHNTLLGSENTVNANIHGSYVLGNNVNVNTSNSVYFGDASTAYTNGILTTSNGNTPTEINMLTNVRDIEKYGISIGEKGQTSAVIAGRSYNFAGVGLENGGVISVGRVVGMTTNNTIVTSGETPAYYASIGRIIQNVAPGLIGANSTDAINGSQLYAIMIAVDYAISRVASGENGPIVYTTDNGERLYKENNIFYKPIVTTVPNENGIGSTIYKQASNGLWYSSDSFDENGLLNSNIDINEGKTLKQLAQGRTDSVVVQPSSLILSVVNAEKDNNENTKEEATKTLTVLKNIKNVLNVLSNDEVNNNAKELYKTQTTNANDEDWNNLSQNEKKQWQEKIIINNAKEKIASLLEQNDDERYLSQAVSLKDLKTLSQAGLDFSGDIGNAIHKNLSETLAIKGGIIDEDEINQANNIAVINQENGVMAIKLAKNLKGLSSVAFDNNDYKISLDKSTNSFKFEGKDGDVITLSNIKAGEKDNDAVNYSQLKSLKTTLENNINQSQTGIYSIGANIERLKTAEENGFNVYYLKNDNFISQVDEQNNKLILAADGKYYTKENLSNFVFFNGEWYKAENGKLVDTTEVPQESTFVENILFAADKNGNNVKLFGIKSAIEGEITDTQNTFIENVNNIGKEGENAISKNATATTLDVLNIVNTGFNIGINNDTQLKRIKLNDVLRIRQGQNTNISYLKDNETNENIVVIENTGNATVFENQNGDKLSKLGDDYYKQTDIENGKAKTGAEKQELHNVSINNNEALTMNNVKSKINTVEIENEETPTFSKKLDELTKTEEGKNYVATTGDLKNIKNLIEDINEIANSGFNVNIEADGGSIHNNNENEQATNIAPNENITFVAGQNISLSLKNNEIKIDANVQGIANNAKLPIAYYTEKGKKVYLDAVTNKFYLNADLTGDAIDLEKDNIITKVVSYDKEGNEVNVKINNVADGEISKTSTDAINGKQLYELKELLGENNIVNNINTKEITIVNENNEETTINVPVDENGELYLKTYNVHGKTEDHTNNLFSAIQNINEQGIKFVHVNNGQKIKNANKQNEEDSSASGIHSIAIGYKTSIGEDAISSIGLGAENNVTGASSIAIGKNNTVSGRNAIAIGEGHSIKGNNSGAFGDPTYINADNSYAIGNNNKIDAENGFILGNDSKIDNDAKDAIVIGNNANASVENSIAIGSYAKTTRGKEQLQKEKAFGENDEANEIKGTGTSVVGEVSFGNQDNAQTRRLTNVSAGVLDTDAVNVSQLKSIKSSFNNVINQNMKEIRNNLINVNKQINQMNERINKAMKEMHAIGATAAAMANLPQITVPGRGMISAAIGTYKNKQAIAVGISHMTDNGKFVIKASASYNSQEVAAGVGFGYIY